MPVITPTITKPTEDDSVQLVVWAGMANGDTGAPIKLPAHADRSVHISGTFGAGGTCVMQGSNNSSSYVTLTDPQGNALSKTAEAVEVIEEVTLLTRPNVTAGDGTTAITVSMLLRRPNPMRT